MRQVPAMAGAPVRHIVPHRLLDLIGIHLITDEQQRGRLLRGNPGSSTAGFRQPQRIGTEHIRPIAGDRGRTVIGRGPAGAEKQPLRSRGIQSTHQARRMRRASRRPDRHTVHCHAVGHRPPRGKTGEVAERVMVPVHLESVGAH